MARIPVVAEKKWHVQLGSIIKLLIFFIVGGNEVKFMKTVDLCCGNEDKFITQNANIHHHLFSCLPNNLAPGNWHISVYGADI